MISGSLDHAILFYLFASVLMIGALGVILGRNPVHSVLFLILAFFNAAGLFILLNAELVAMLLVIVYVGAVAVLFLFVVMMLDVNFKELRQEIARYMPFALVAGIIIAMELCAVGLLWRLPQLPGSSSMMIGNITVSNLTNTQSIGLVLYTDYVLMFQLAGMILLVAMIGAIVLALRKRTDVLRQDVKKQNRRKPEDTLVMHKIQSGEGVKIR